MSCLRSVTLLLCHGRTVKVTCIVDKHTDPESEAADFLNYAAPTGGTVLVTFVRRAGVKPATVSFLRVLERVKHALKSPDGFIDLATYFGEAFEEDAGDPSEANVRLSYALVPGPARDNNSAAVRGAERGGKRRRKQTVSSSLCAGLSIGKGTPVVMGSA